MITINNVTVTVNQILVEVDKETFSKSVQGKLEQPVTQATEPQQAPAEAPAKRTRRTKEEIQAAEQPVTQPAEPTGSSRILPAEHVVESPARRSFEEEQPTRAPEPPARRSFSDETATAPEPPATGRRRSFSDDAKAPTESQQATAPTRRSYAD